MIITSYLYDIIANKKQTSALNYPTNVDMP